VEKCSNCNLEIGECSIFKNENAIWDKKWLPYLGHRAYIDKKSFEGLELQCFFISIIGETPD
jgi:hypothetical protein